MAAQLLMALRLAVGFFIVAFGKMARAESNIGLFGTGGKVMRCQQGTYVRSIYGMFVSTAEEYF